MRVKKNLFLYVLAGGDGRRLWPASTTEKPKPFLLLHNNKSLLQETVERNNFCVIPHKVILSAAHKAIMLADSLTMNQKCSMLLEHQPEGTFFSTVMAAFDAQARDVDACVLLAPSDHYIENVEQYKKAINAAHTLASEENFVMLGITPQNPNTGYGYIKIASNNTVFTDPFKITAFHEKPDSETARSYFDSKEYLWNSGIFIFHASAFLEEVQTLYPDFYHSCKAQCAAIDPTKEVIDLPHCPPEMIGLSLDIAFCQNSHNMFALKCNFDWADLGSWENIWALSKHDDFGNVVNTYSILSGVKDCFFKTDKKIIGIDLENLALIEEGKEILLMKLKSSEKLKNVLRAKDPKEPIPRQELKPWGLNIRLSEQYGQFLVKQLNIMPGHKISLQYHHHRSEYWTVAAGIGELVIGSEIRNIKSGDQIVIKPMEVHRVQNTGKDELIIIEVQLGKTIREDDIVRLQDEYGRKCLEKN